MSCTNGVCATYMPPLPIANNTFWDEWYMGQTFKSKLVGIDADCDILLVSWWLGSHEYSGIVHASIRATDEEGKPTGSDLSTGSYFQPPVAPDQAVEEKHFNMTPFKLLAGVQYAVLLWIEGGDPFHYMYAACSWPSLGAYPYGGYTYSWDWGVTWGVIEYDTDWHFEVYGCIYPSEIEDVYLVKKRQIIIC